MPIVFAILALITMGGALAAMTWRNLVHCALGLVLAFAGMACLFLQLDAQFVGFAQILVYVGAVAILIVFAILLTRSGEDIELPATGTRWKWSGVAVAVVVFGAMAWCISSSSISGGPATGTVAHGTVKEIGQWLMLDAILPLEVLGMLLTAALIGAVVLLIDEKRRRPNAASSGTRAGQTGPSPGAGSTRPFDGVLPRERSAGPGGDGQGARLISGNGRSQNGRTEL